MSVMGKMIFSSLLLCLLATVCLAAKLEAASAPANQPPAYGDYFGSNSDTPPADDCNKRFTPLHLGDEAAYCACVRDARIAQENWAYAHNPVAATPEAQIRHAGQLSVLKASCSKYGPSSGPDQFPTQTNNQSPGVTSQSCIYDVGSARVQEILRARPGVCQRYGSDRIICQADNSQVSPARQNARLETWDQKITRELEAQIEAEATGATFDHTPTQIKIRIFYNTRRRSWESAWQPTSASYSSGYWQLADRVLSNFSAQRRLLPPDNRPRENLVISLGTVQPASASTDGSQSARSCPYIPGRYLEGGTQQTQIIDDNNSPYSNPSFSGGTSATPSGPPQPQPERELVYGRMWWRPAGQNLYFPIDIQVPRGLALNHDQPGPLLPGPAGQYYIFFFGHLERNWNAQTGYGGVFRIMQLQLVSGAWVSLSQGTIPGFPVQLGPNPLPPAKPTPNPR